jgi:hypothetical protein
MGVAVKMVQVQSLTHHTWTPSPAATPTTPCQCPPPPMTRARAGRASASTSAHFLAGRWRITHHHSSAMPEQFCEF